MPSSYSASARYTLQATGENANVWGNILNSGVFSLVDYNINGVLSVSTSGAKTLTVANGATDEARAAFINYTGLSAGVLTIPSVPKIYQVRASVAQVTITNGSNSVVVYPGGVTTVMTDGSGVWKAAPDEVPTPTRDSQPSTKKYVDDTAFAANAGILPGQGGNANGYLSTDGTTAGWRVFSIATIPLLQTTLDGKEPIDRATAANFRADTNAKLLASDVVWDAADFVVVTYAAAVTLSFSAFFNARINLTGNITFNAPTNLKPGQSGVIKLVQDATGSRLATFNAAFKFGSGIKTLSTGPSQIDYLSYVIDDAGNVICNLTRAPS